MSLHIFVDDYADVLSKVLTNSIPHLKFINNTSYTLHVYRDNIYLMSLVPNYEPNASQGQYALTEFEIGNVITVTTGKLQSHVTLTNRWVRNVTITI